MQIKQNAKMQIKKYLPTKSTVLDIFWEHACACVDNHIFSAFTIYLL